MLEKDLPHRLCLIMNASIKEADEFISAMAKE
jgi:hypothetical protein